MKDVPILFQPEMVDAILAGRKTMTRRLAWRPARKDEPTGEGSRLTHVPSTKHPGVGEVVAHQRPSDWTKIEPGDTIWVRERHWQWGHWSREDLMSAVVNVPRKQFVNVSTALVSFAFGNEAPGHRGTSVIDDQPGWHCRPSIFLPKDKARIKLEVTEVKVEPLQSISLDDVRAEGVEVPDSRMVGAGADQRQKIGSLEFGELWCRIHGNESWYSNPDVVAISFKVIAK